jgi:arylsulfatase A-like enzyme
MKLHAQSSKLQTNSNRQAPAIGRVDHRSFVLGAWILALFLHFELCPPSFAAAARPNILFYFSDDQRWDTIHALGHPDVKTPNLDKLFEGGFRFNNAYCQGAMIGAVCLPSRTMLMTGQSLWHCPQQMRAPTPPAGAPLLPKLLNEAGYVTFHCGKAGNSCTFANATFKTNIEQKNRTATTVAENADEAVKFLNQHDGKNPFFIYLAPQVPHDPRLAPPEFVKMYDPKNMTLAKCFMPDHPFDNGELHVRDEELAPHPRTPEVMRQHLADYYATISHLDSEFGRIVSTLKERGLSDNTIIVFSADQGLAVGGQHGLMGKQNFYENFKSPLVFLGPGIPHGQSDALVYLYDLMPTFCELTGLSIPSNVEGKSILPVVKGAQPRVRDSLFCAYKACQRMVRDERWKLMKYNASGVKNIQLFDLKNDPDELSNLASDSKYASEVARLEKLLTAARKEFGDPTDFDGTGLLPADTQPAKQKKKKAQ